jgi:hypothetical protein
MPLRKHDTVSEDEMNWLSPNHTICQLLREIYHKSTDAESRFKCRVAVSMAKAMSHKLEKYKAIAKQ